MTSLAKEISDSLFASFVCSRESLTWLPSTVKLKKWTTVLSYMYKKRVPDTYRRVSFCHKIASFHKDLSIPICPAIPQGFLEVLSFRQCLGDFGGEFVLTYRMFLELLNNNTCHQKDNYFDFFIDCIFWFRLGLSGWVLERFIWLFFDDCFGCIGLEFWNCLN